VEGHEVRRLEPAEQVARAAEDEGDELNRQRDPQEDAGEGSLVDGKKRGIMDVLRSQKEGAAVEDVVYGVDCDDHGHHDQAEGEAEGEEGHDLLAWPSIIELHFENLSGNQTSSWWTV
jgi:hypothetical protein